MPHKNSRRRALSFLFFSIFFNYLAINSAIADAQISTTQEQLNKISQIVAEIEDKLEKSHKNQEHVQQELTQLEREIGKLHQQIDTTKHQVKASKQALERLELERHELDQRIDQQGDYFKQQIRLAYITGEQSKWKLLLSQNSLQHVGRNAVIYDYIHRARAQQIEEMKLLVQQLSQNQQDLQQENETLQNLVKKQSIAQAGLEKTRKEKQTIHAKLAKLISDDRAQLKQEKTKQNQLRKLLNKLTFKHPTGKFGQQKGKLHWPIKGSLKRKFGQSRQSSANTHWNGALIVASKGTEINAIYPGTVVFADWFDHYGWLMIIDHGDDYMSLYAHAEGLYREVDDEVSAGDLIAVAGDSGDIDETGLYFEIRRQGTPVDPASWCVTPKMAYSP